MTPWGWLLAAAVALVILPPLLAWLMCRSRAAAREGLPGRMLRLPDGLTRVTVDGLPGRPVAVLVHGLTTPSWVFDAIAAGLVVLGWRVVRHDLWGRGGSDMPGKAQNRALFVRQLAGVIEAEAGDARVLLVGYSMGAAISAAYAEAYPSHVRGLAMLAPAGLGHRMEGFTRFCAATPVLGDWLWATFSGPGLRAAARKAARQGPSSVENIATRLAQESRTRGYRRAVLSSIRHMLAEDMRPTLKGLDAAGLPMLAVWGGEDGLILKAAGKRLAKVAPGAEQITVEAAGHGVPHTHPREVLKALTGFLARL
ncbi:alpha/beta fold hydrolase [Vannielia litorea]|uniref:Pimeloyl-ACP methyl ester carboxylesterase n=1 Tax=Vannielia litorea TaxID=1217970 RepID=A0A1N6GYN5_9RHOB|nr:alpha/beta hydrolase [Vannielia litorea]SIO12654.1 Pimeloyl-ACP methyl ester carboxylesterase [Vannielia litorea]